MDVPALHTGSEDEAFLEFLSLYPSYKDTMGIDALRHKEYPHLDEGQVCLDYAGVGLFSSLQRSPELYGGFGIGLSHTSANLATHAMYMEGGSTESFFRKRILKYLNLDEDYYYIVFTANAFSAFRLLGQSYPFHEAESLLLAYDHECENLQALGECAHAKGGLVQSVNLSNPWMKIDGSDLRKKLQGKKKPSTQKIPSKGLFAYPYSSRVTGLKNSSQWIPEAQQNGWHVLLDVTSVDAKFSDSLGLALFSPDFLIGSFYYVFGEDPTGFGCLVIKRSVLRTLGDSSRARAIGMVKIVTRHASSSSPDESPPGSSGRIMDPHIQHLKESPGHRRTRSMHGFSFLEESSADSTSMESMASHTVQDDSKCFERSIANKKKNDGATISMKVLGPRMHMDAPQSAELGPPNKSISSTPSGIKRDKNNGAFNMSRLSCDSETGLQWEAVMSASSHEIIREMGTERASQRANRSKPTEEGIASDSQVASSNMLSFVSSTLESGTGKTPSKPPKIAGRSKIPRASMDMHFTCRGLDHADMLGAKGVTIRLRALANWLISSLSRLRHPQPAGNAILVRIYSQMSLGDRSSIIAFNVVDSAGNVLHPKRVQTLADRSSLSLRTGTIAGTVSSEVQDTEEEPRDMGCVELSHYKWRAKGDTIQNVRVHVVYVSLGFLNNFSDVYKLWLFISKFRDPDFVSQELWHYQALNQETIEI